MGVPAKKSDLVDPKFQAWLAAVEALAERYLGVKLSELPDLPYRDGYELGESPAEFYVGAVVDEVDERPL